MDELARRILTVELALIIFLAMASLVIHATGKWPRTTLARLTWWQLTGVFVVAAIEAGTLLLILYQFQWPVWVLEVVYGLVAVVMAGWLVLRWWARRGAPVRSPAPPES